MVLLVASFEEPLLALLFWGSSFLLEVVFWCSLLKKKRRTPRTAQKIPPEEKPLEKKWCRSKKSRLVPLVSRIQRNGATRFKNSKKRRTVWCRRIQRNGVLPFKEKPFGAVQRNGAVQRKEPLFLNRAFFKKKKRSRTEEHQCFIFFERLRTAPFILFERFFFCGSISQRYDSSTLKNSLLYS